MNVAVRNVRRREAEGLVVLHWSLENLFDRADDATTNDEARTRKETSAWR